MGIVIWLILKFHEANCRWRPKLKFVLHWLGQSGCNLVVQILIASPIQPEQKLRKIICRGLILKLPRKEMATVLAWNYQNNAKVYLKRSSTLFFGLNLKLLGAIEKTFIFMVFLCETALGYSERTNSDENKEWSISLLRSFKCVRSHQNLVIHMVFQQMRNILGGAWYMIWCLRQMKITLIDLLPKLLLLSTLGPH